MAVAFEAAARLRPDELVESWLLSAGGPIRLQVVGRRLADHMAGALGHLAVEEQPRCSGSTCGTSR